MTLGYYGGAINGVTVYLEYAIPTSNIDYYTYSYTVSGNSTIAVTIGSSPTPTGDKIYVKSGGAWKEASNIYVKVNGTWQKVVNVYKKVSGSWVLQSDKSSLFSQDVSYINGDNL